MGYENGYRIFNNDFNKILDALKNNGVIIGLEVTQQTTPAMGITVESGVMTINRAPSVKIGSSNVSIDAADATNPRKDLIVINSEGVLSVVKGNPDTKIPSANTGVYTRQPKPQSIPANSIVLAEVWVAANATQIVTADITDRRVFIEVFPMLAEVKAQVKRYISSEIARYDAMTEQWYFYESGGIYYVKDQTNTNKATGVDGTTVLNDGFDLLGAAGGGCMLIKDERTYDLGQLVIYGKIKVKGEYGDSTILKCAAETNAHFIINGQRAGVYESNIIIETINIDANNDNNSGDSYDGIRFLNAHDIIMYNLLLRDSHYSGIYCGISDAAKTSYDLFFLNNRFYERSDAGAPDIFPQGYSYIAQVENVFMLDNYGENSLKIGVMNGNKLFIVGNTLKTSKRGISCRSIYNSIIVDNLLDGVTATDNEAAIFLEAPTGYPSRNVLIARNTIKDSACAGISTSTGFEPQIFKLVVIYNKVSNCTGDDIHIKAQNKNVVCVLNATDNAPVIEGIELQPPNVGAITDILLGLYASKRPAISSYIAYLMGTQFAKKSNSGCTITDLWDSTNGMPAKEVKSAVAGNNAEYVGCFLVPNDFIEWNAKKAIEVAFWIVPADSCTATVSIYDTDGNLDATKNETAQGVDIFTFAGSELTGTYEKGKKFLVVCKAEFTGGLKNILWHWVRAIMR